MVIQSLTGVLITWKTWETCNIMTNQEIGSIIKDIRNRRGLSIRALGELSGVQFANIGKLERGEYNPSVNILNKILLALNCELIVREKDNNTKVSNYEES